MFESLPDSGSLPRRDFLRLASAAGAGWSLCGPVQAQSSDVFYNCVEIEPWYVDAFAENAKSIEELRKQGIARSAAAIQDEARAAKFDLNEIFPRSPVPDSVLESVPAATEDVMQLALEIASAKNPSEFGGLESLDDDVGVGELEAVFERAKRWLSRRVKVQLLQSIPRIDRAVRKAAEEWSKYCGIEFVFVRTNGQIRVDYDSRMGHCSLIGLESAAMNLPGSTRASMNIMPSDVLRQNDQYMLSIVLHEFGHALGLLHEHQNPNGVFEWNKPVVESILRKQGWNDQMIIQNVYAKVERNDSKYAISKFDPDSIMIYPWPRGTVRSGVQPPTTWNKGPSPTDQSVVRKMYGVKAPLDSKADAEEKAPKIKVETDPRKKLKAADAKVLELNTVTEVTFEPDHEIALFKFTAPRKDVTKDSADEFVFETVDGPRAGAKSKTSVPAVIEFFSDPTDFSESKADRVSKLGVAATDDDPGSIGVEDAYQRRPIVTGTTGYLLVRALRRLQGEDAPVQFRLLARRVGIERPNGLDEGAFARLMKKKK